jgi:hypothetical protein
VPSTGGSMLSFDWHPEKITSHLSHSHHRTREFDEFSKVGKGRHITSRMKPGEKAIYRKQLIDRAKR